MNWKQLYTSATPKEREEILLVLLRFIEAKTNRLQGHLIREHRHAPTHVARFVNDRHHPRIGWPRAILFGTFAFTLLTVSTATWLVFVYAPAELTAPILFFYIISLTAMLLKKRRPLFENSSANVLLR